MSREKFTESIVKSYTTSGSSIYLGAGIYQGEILADAKVNLPLKMMNRHGLVTGATGSVRRGRFNYWRSNFLQQACLSLCLI